MHQFTRSGVQGNLLVYAGNKDLGWQQRYVCFCGRISVLALLLYPFLWAWSLGLSLLPEGQKWDFLIWLLFSYCGLVCIAGICIGMVLADMVRVPDWALDAAGQEMRGMGQDAAAYQPGPYLTPAQKEAVEAFVQELPKFRLKAVPIDCSECPRVLCQR